MNKVTKFYVLLSFLLLVLFGGITTILVSFDVGPYENPTVSQYYQLYYLIPLSLVVFILLCVYFYRNFVSKK